MSLLYEAVRALTSVCDGARTEDAQGWNGTHTNYGHYLASVPLERWSHKMKCDAYDMVRTYRYTQLPRFGIEFEEIPDPHLEQPTCSLFIVDSGRAVGVRSDKNFAFIDEIKKIRGRRWNSTEFRWEVPAEKTLDLMKVVASFYPATDFSPLEAQPQCDHCLRFFTDRTESGLCPECEAHSHESDVIGDETPSPLHSSDRLDLEGRVIVVRTAYDQTFIDKIRALPVRKWDKEAKVWKVPMECAGELCLAFSEHFPDGRVDPEIIFELEKVEAKKELSTAAMTDKIITLPGCNLYPFQSIGYDFLKLQKGIGLVGDEMGLGKTIQALAYLFLERAMPALIVVPASLKRNWELESIKRIGLLPVVLSGTKPRPEAFAGAPIVIINYDIVSSWAETLEGQFETIVLDEAHYIKSPKSQRSATIRALAASIPRRILLTGTPMMNRPADLWHLLHVLDPAAFPKFFQFAQRYCNAVRTKWGWDFKGASNTKELHERLMGHYMIRRLKADVLTELPPKIITSVPIQLGRTERRQYEEAALGCAEAVKEILGSEKRNLNMVLARIGALRQVTAKLKLPQCIDWISDAIENCGQIVVFAHHHEIVKGVAEAFKAPTISGMDNLAARQRAIEEFQAGKHPVIVCSIAAAGVGITLTAASNVVFLERPWRPADCDQAEDRCHRIGQKERVSAWYLDAENTIDSFMTECIDSKRGVIGSIIDGKTNAGASTVAIQAEVIKKLLGSMAISENHLADIIESFVDSLHDDSAYESACESAEATANEERAFGRKD